MNTKTRNILVMIFLVVLLVLNFSKNFLNTNIPTINPVFEGFQSDSEYLVFSEILQDKIEKDEKAYGLAIILDEKNERKDDIWTMITKSNNEQDQIKVTDYSSQFGLQGHIFSFLYNKIKVPFWCMKLMCCLSLAIILVAICYFINSKYGKLMAGVFYITFLLSPWVVAFAKNLYWVEFTWFLPVLLGLILSTDYKKKKILVPSIFGAILIKCLCGYEYISTIMLGTIAFFIIDFLTVKETEKRKEIIKTILIVGISCILAFGTALLIHASIRGEGKVIEGVKNIYKNDVLRRTIISSDKDKYTGAYKESMDASVLETVSKYFEWESDIILGVGGRYFKAMFISTIAVLIYKIIKKDKNFYRDTTMFITFLGTTLSWYILAKSHSYIHTHINFVLWYFGFVQICLYIMISFICQKVYIIGKKMKKESNIIC